MAAVADEADAAGLRRLFPDVEIVSGEEGREAVAIHPDATTVVAAFVGALGLVPTYRALMLGREVALANKETLVAAGDLMMAAAAAHGGAILPVDSEHNALHQALRVGLARRSAGSS